MRSLRRPRRRRTRTYLSRNTRTGIRGEYFGCTSKNSAHLPMRSADLFSAAWRLPALRREVPRPPSRHRAPRTAVRRYEVRSALSGVPSSTSTSRSHLRGENRRPTHGGTYLVVGVAVEAESGCGKRWAEKERRRVEKRRGVGMSNTGSPGALYT